MVHCLSPRASQDYLELTIESKNLGVVGQIPFLERLSVLTAVGSPGAAIVYAQAVLEHAQWVGGPPLLGGGVLCSPLSSKLSFPGRAGCVFEVLEGKLAPWVIRTADEDIFPSIPSARHKENSAERLDVFLGWSYCGSQQSGRLDLPLLVALWNDEKFRGVVAEALQYCGDRHHRYRWRLLA